MENHLSELLHQVERSALVGVTEEPYGWLPIRLATNADMSAVWKMNQFGGAIKRDENPCHCCNICNDDIVVPNDDKDQCRWCCRLGHDKDDTKKCYHYKMLTDEVVESMDADLTKLEELFHGMLDEVYVHREKSEILCNENPRIAKKSSMSNPSSIHYKIKKHTPGQVRVEYNAQLMHDLELRGMDSASGSIRDRQQ
ncbi:hypothetical protein ACA910_012424 [Epithemia clementina (nom. ined.)]